jgi:outer membrane receptor protein involved in Fe transport
MNNRLGIPARSAMFASAAVLALAIGTPAAAQTQPAASPPGNQNADDLNLQEIIVTAQKRAENVQDVPASVSVVGEQQLKNLQVTQLADIAAYVPGFQVDSGGSPGQTTITLRGIAPVGPGQTVGIYLDDTPIGSSSFFARANIFSLDLLPYDIGRLEVLRGPQGTLYGASSIGGLLKYVTKSPNLTQFEVQGGGEIFDIASGGDLGWGARAGINAPLVAGKVGIRASYAYQHTPGYIDNLVTGEKDQNEYTQQGGRLALLWEAAPNVSLKLSALWQKVKADDNATVAFSLPPSEALGNGRSNVNTLPEPFEKEFAHFGATLDWDLGFATVTSATSYQDTTTKQTTDATDVFGILFPLLTGGQIPAGTSRFDLRLDLKKWTQELRLASPTGSKFEWLLGAFYTHEDSKNFQVATAQADDGTSIPGLDPLADVQLPSTYQEYALFGNATYRFSDLFHLTGGLRWAHNKQDFTQISSGALLPPGTTPGKSSESVWTYSVSPQFHLSEDTMLYARVASGYRPGGPNVVTFGNPPPTVGSDSLVNYEVGLKTEFLNHMGLFDVAAFYMDWKDIQVTVAEGGVSFLDNAGKARSQGIEASLVLRPIRGLSLSANGSYIDAELTEDAPSVSGSDGDALPQIAKWSGSLLADYSWPLTGRWTGHVGAGLRLVGDRPQAFRTDPNFLVADGYQAVDLNASVSDDRWTVRAYVKNLTDEHAELTKAVFVDGLNRPVRITGTPLQPRTIGLSLDVRY